MVFNAMGASFVNYQVRTSDAAAVVSAVEQIITSHAAVSAERNGWVTVYDQSSDSQDTGEIDRLSHELSLSLQAPLFTFLVHDAKLLVYYLFDAQGCLIDEFNSAPEYFGQMVTDDARQRFGGQSVALEPFCRAGISRGDIEAVLKYARAPVDGSFASTVPAELRLRHLATLLGIDAGRATRGFNMFNQTPPTDAAEFVQVQTRRRRPNPRNQVLPRIPPKK